MGNVYETWNRDDTTNSVIAVCHPWHIYTLPNRGNYGIIGRELTHNGTGAEQNNAQARCTEALPNADMHVSQVIKTWHQPGVTRTGNNAYHAVVARIKDETGDAIRHGYFMEVERHSSTWYLFRRVNGVQTALAQGSYGEANRVPDNRSNPAVMRIEVQGSTIRLYWRGVLVHTQTDTTIPAAANVQYAGIFTYGGQNALRMDDFTAGDPWMPQYPPYFMDSMYDEFSAPLSNPSGTGFSYVDPAAALVGGRLALPQTTNYPGVNTDARNMVGNGAHVEWEPGPPGAKFTRETLYNAFSAFGTNRVQWIVSGTQLWPRIGINNVYTDGPRLTFSVGAFPAAYRWVRFRHEGPSNDGTMVFESSPDNVTWTERWRVVCPWDVRRMHLQLQAGMYDATDGTDGVSYYDNLNMIPAVGEGRSVTDLGWRQLRNDYLTANENATHDGQPLRLNGVTFARGIGVHAYADLQVAVPGGAKVFRATVGLGDSASGADSQGSVVVEVWREYVDTGQLAARLYQSPVLTQADRARTISVDVVGIPRGENLRLVMADAGDGNGWDHGVWGDPRFMSSLSLLLSGTIGAAGSVLRSFSPRVVDGSVAPTGSVESRKVAFAALAGVLAVAGSVERMVPRTLVGAVSTVGNYLRLPLLSKGGSTQPGASYRLGVQRNLASSLELQGEALVSFLGRVFGRAGIVVLRVWSRGEVLLRIRRPN